MKPPTLVHRARQADTSKESKETEREEERERKEKSKRERKRKKYGQEGERKRRGKERRSLPIEMSGYTPLVQWRIVSDRGP